MRRTILVSLFFLGACGGGMASTDAVSRVPPGGSSRADAYSVLMSAEGQAVVDSFASSSSQDALDTCIAAWLDADDSLEPQRKPSVVGLRSFLSACLDSSTPGDFKTDRGAGVRYDGNGGLRDLAVRQ